MIEFLGAYWEILTIPFVGGFVGWFTNEVAIWMMFHPTEFWGIRPFLGWQGIVPANAERLARVSTRIITTKLLSLKELFSSFSANQMRDHLEHVVEDITNQIIEEVVKRAPMLWENAGEFMQAKVRDAVREEIREVITRIVGEFGENIERILDLEKVTVEAVVRDKKLMSQMFLEVGQKEFRFVANSGWWFGGLFGLVQMAIWIVYPEWWILPLFGFLVGYATNWLALKLVFEPKEPTKYGPFVVQGLFHKRQHEVAEKFSELVAGRVLNADNIVQTVLSNETKEEVMRIVEKHVDELVAKYEQHPLAAMALPEEERPALREELKRRIRDDLPKPGGLLHTFAARSVDIREELRSRMKSLDADSFESVLRPAFQQDEWKLIVLGAVLGLAAGILQLVYMFKDAFAASPF